MLAFVQLRRLPVHASMLEISELIYSTCKAYLVKQGKFLLMLWVFIAAVIVVYYRFLIDFPWGKVAIVIGFSLLGHGRLLRRRLVRHPRQHVRQLAHRVRRPARHARCRCTGSR